MTSRNYQIASKLEFEYIQRELRLSRIAAKLGRSHITNKKIRLAQKDNRIADTALYDRFVYTNIL